MEKESKYTKTIENLIINALDSQCDCAREDNFSDMNTADKTEYDENTARMIELECIIDKMLTPEGKEMFKELDTLTGANLSIESRYMFNRGAIEGLTSLEYLKETSECIYLPMIKL